MSDLEYALRAVGFATTVLGTCAAVPYATWQLLRQVRTSIVTIANKLLRRSTTAHVSLLSASGSTSVSVSGTMTAVGHAVGNTIGERLDQQEEAKRIDTRALPIVIVGVALSTFTEELSLNAVVGVMAICVGLGFFFWAWSMLDQERSGD